MTDAARHELQRRALELFEAVLDLEEEQRPAYIDERTSGDTELRKELLGLLEVERNTDDLDPILVNVDLLLGEAAPAAPRQLGPYLLGVTLGRGGMGEVRLAERADGAFRRQVAVKLIRAGLDSAELLSRFRRERQVQAALDHPHIARMLDGGQDERGAPYIVMEYVRGTSIESFCDRLRLSTIRRLELFLEVCSAVHYAHQMGVIHRDLKPGNILVTEAGEPKLLDFGIAKVLDSGKLSAELTLTQEAFLIMTPAYASPEQLRYQDAIPASDQYALGVILYQLLSGHLPHALDSRSPAEIERIVGSELPERPSRALMRAAEQITPDKVGACRRSSPRTLRKELSGDLDRIVLMALKKEPQRRYVSVEQMAADIRRYLDGRPVLARADTLSYRATRFVQRNRLPVALAVGIVLSLVAGLLITLQQAEQAREARRQSVQERDESEAVTSFLTEMIASTAPGRMSRYSTVRDLLDGAAGSLETGRFQNRPLLEARIRATLGHSYLQVSALDAAELHLLRAHQLRLAALGAEHELTSDVEGVLGAVYKEQGRYAESEQLMRLRLEHVRRVRAPDDPELFISINNLAGVLRIQEHYEQARKLFQEAHAGLVAGLGEGHRESLIAMNNLALCTELLGQHDRALELFELCVERSRISLGDDDPDTLIHLHNLGRTLNLYHDSARALQLLEPLLAAKCRVLGEGHNDTCRTRGVLASSLRAVGQLEDGLALELENLYFRRTELGSQPVDTAQTLRNIAFMHYSAKQSEQAGPHILCALAILDSTRGFDDPETLEVALEAALTLGRLERLQESTALLERVLTSYERRGEVGSRKWQQAARNLAAIFQQWGQREEVARVLEIWLEGLRQSLGDNDPETVRVMHNTAARQFQLGRFALAEPLALEAYELKLTLDDLPQAKLVSGVKLLIGLYQAWNRPEEETYWRDVLTDYAPEEESSSNP